ncbi:PREDICTED: uncharacterized protein LOC109586231 [Amphimedon queenslandica]|uniref:Uncharacterized protein n=1 Tax=Amphimedon queenslandica TaxID=400682 RepID=A0AAN0JMC2_AMPQE|nr:PREDICTED: uncharacterized protein LOC109586231 [Amphimedon queenslandica]|eukprot:XP_019857967.1 PREDICTED: uncharacterized protein LOC109586231 [Amphimedon queenslandica]
MGLNWRRILSSLKRSVYNKETKEVLGRTGVGWSQLGAFYFAFYLAIGIFFAAHLAIFLGMTPHPAPGVLPWNFGRYAYPNYPNSKIGIVDTNGSYTTYRSKFRHKLLELVDHTNASDVYCTTDNNYGFTGTRACILLYIAKVFEWTPNTLEPFIPGIRFGSHLPISCSIEEAHSSLGIQLALTAPGIPLTIPNNEFTGSFPYANQDNFSIPLVGVGISVSNVTLASNYAKFDVRVTCGVNRTALNIAHWDESRINKVFELPSNTTFLIHFVRAQL